MAIWSNTTKTEKGIALEQKLLTLSKPLKLVMARSGSGTVNPTQLAKQTSVQQPKQELELRSAYLSEGNTVTVPVMLSNTGLTEGYNLFQVGIYAEDPDDGEILYIITQTDIANGEQIPSAAESPGYSIDWNFAIKISLSSSIEVVVNEAGKLTLAQADARYVQTEVMNQALFTKVDKVPGKGLSSNDYTNEEKQKVHDAAEHVANIDIHVTKTEKSAWNNKVDKVPGAGLSSNDYTAADKEKVANLPADTNAVLEGKENKATITLYTLLAEKWDSESKTYSFEEEYPEAQYHLTIQPSEHCNEEQYEAWGNSMILGNSTSNVYKALGEVPQVDVPIILKVVKK